MTQLAAAKAEPDVKVRQSLVLGALGVVFGDIGTSPLATEFFRIPSNRVIELGGQIEI